MLRYFLTALSIIIWCKPTHADYMHYGSCQYNYGSKQGWDIQHTVAVKPTWFLGNGTTLANITFDADVTNNVWYLGVWTYDGTTMRSYKNGVAQAATASLTSPIIYSGSGTLMFARFTTGTNYKSGQTLYGIFNRALPAGEVAQFYQQTRHLFL